MINCNTYQANIYVGSKPGYSGEPHPKSLAERICQGYCDKVGLGLTLTETTFIYTDGNEPGFIVGLINYPRFPSTEVDIRFHAMALAKALMELLDQQRVSVVCSDKTYMLENEVD